MSADGTQLSGTFKQLGKSFPLALQRTAEADLAAQPLTAGDYAPRADSDLQGEWAGALQVAGTQLRLNLKIAEPTPGTFHAALDSVDQGAQNLPVTSLTYQKPDVHFQLDSINGRYEGTLDERDDQLSGTWTQMGKKFPLTFKRVSTNAIAETVLDYGNGSSYQVQGHWKGALTMNNVTLHLVFHIGLTPEGDYAASLDSPDQGASGLPASSADYTYPTVRLEWQAIGGVFKAQLKGGRLVGTWSQGKISRTLELARETAN